jgi:hypothetical protein
MGTTSSFFGGGGGGGGDPQAVFKAISNISANDLVSLKSNGTVESIFSTPTSLSFGAEDYTRPTFPMAPEYTNNKETQVFYHPTRDKYIILSRASSDLYILTASLSGNTLTVQANNAAQTEVFGSVRAFDAAWDSVSETLVVSIIQTNDYASVYTVTYSTFDNRFERSDSAYSSGANFTGDVAQVAVKGDGTGVAVFQYNGASTRAFAFSYVNTGATPTWRSGTSGDSILSGDRILASSTKYNYLFHISGTDYGILYHTNTVGTPMYASISDGGTSVSSSNIINPFTSANFGKGQFAYDPVNKIAIFGTMDNGAFKSFKIDGLTPSTPANLANMPIGFYTAITFSSNLNKFVSVHVESGGSGSFVVSTFSVDAVTSSCVDVVSDTFSSFAGTNTGTNIFLEFPQLYAPDPDSDKVIVVANNNNDNKELQIVGNPKYLATNIDNYIGEAKEDISSGSTGAVALLKRDVTLPAASFDKGQTLYANSSGSLPSSSGTNKVGYATSSTTMLVTGDQT